MRAPLSHPSPCPRTADEVTTTTCYMCACRCGIKVWLERRADPLHPGQSRRIRSTAACCARRARPGSCSTTRRRGWTSRCCAWASAAAASSARSSGTRRWRSRPSWLAPIRARNPDELAFFTGRDQSQALTGWWAQQFGTVNYAAHGGFCSVNMAAGGLYTLGGSFWEFGEPDWEHTQYLMLWGVAEDHDSNPIKLGLGKLKARGAKIVAVNPVRTGYGAIADEWIGIRPGTDGLFAFALIHELLQGRSHRPRLPGALHQRALAGGPQSRAAPTTGCSRATPTATPLCCDPQAAARAAMPNDIDISPVVVGEYTLRRRPHAPCPSSTCVAERYLDPQYSPDAVSERCGIPADTIRRIARELAEVAFDEAIALPIAWTDAWGREHAHDARPPGRDARDARHQRAQQRLPHLPRAAPAAAAARRGRYAGLVPLPAAVPEADPAAEPARQDAPGRTARSMPRRSASCTRPTTSSSTPTASRAASTMRSRGPIRSPAHGMLHTVIRNAWAGDPYRIDTLMLFMANMSWNSAMNTARDDALAHRQGRRRRVPHPAHHLRRCLRVGDGRLRRPRAAGHDLSGALRRDLAARPADLRRRRRGRRDPPSGARCRRRRAPGRDVRGFQSVLLDLGARLGLPGMVDDGRLRRSIATTPTTSCATSARPASACSPAGAATHGELEGKGAPNPEQLQRYIEQRRLLAQRDSRGRALLQDGQPRLSRLGAAHGLRRPAPSPIVLQLYSETLQKFRLAAQGHGAHAAAGASIASAWRRYFDPLPIWYEPFEGAQIRSRRTLSAAAPITQRPMFMYHAWGSQNAWLRQIATRNWLYLHPDTGARYGIADEDWVDVDSHHGTITVQAKFAANVQPDTVWTLERDRQAHAARGGSAKDAPEGERGLPAQPPDLRHHAEGRLRQRRSGDRPGGVVRPARAHRARPRHRRRQTERAAVRAAAISAAADNQPLRYGVRFARREHRARRGRTR